MTHQSIGKSTPLYMRPRVQSHFTPLHSIKCIMRPATRLAAACRLPTTAACVPVVQPDGGPYRACADAQHRYNTGPHLSQAWLKDRDSDRLRTSRTPLAGPGVSPMGSSSRLVKPLLLVSDLDDTLVAHTTAAPGADVASAAFKAMWEGSRAAGINCKLAINTGRWETAAAELDHTQPAVLATAGSSFMYALPPMHTLCQCTGHLCMYM
jgi:hypothetical protein